MDRKRKADGGRTELSNIVIPEMDMSDSGTPTMLSPDAVPSDRLAKMVLSAGTSSGPSADGGVSPCQSKMAGTSARLSKMLQDAGTSACQNPAVTALLSIAAENVSIASILCTVAKAKRRILENKQLPEYCLGLDAVRLKELRALQVMGNKIGYAHVAKCREAELDYQQKINPLYQRRNEIVAGVTENDKGVPDFWLSALLGNAVLDNEITEWDEYPLKHLMNINCYKTDATERSLKLEFVFDGHNPYFDNTVLTKVIYYKSVQGEYVVDRTEGTSINWLHWTCGCGFLPHDKSFFNFFSSCDDRADVGDDKLTKMKLHERIAKAIEFNVMRHAYTLYLDTKASGKL